MINLNRIRSLQKLEDMKSDLKEFISNPIVKEIYIEDYNWGEEDYGDDVELATELLQQIERRIVSLTKFNQREAQKDSHKLQKSVLEASTEEH